MTTTYGYDDDFFNGQVSLEEYLDAEREVEIDGQLTVDDEALYLQDLERLGRQRERVLDSLAENQVHPA